MPLTLKLPSKSYAYSDELEKFLVLPERTIVLEHSLVSISKWESTHHKPLLSKHPKHMMTDVEMYEYIKCMTITQNVAEEVFMYQLTDDNITSISKYMENAMTATVIGQAIPQKSKQKPPAKMDYITSEVIYSQMVNLQIDKEYEKWHINRLLTLIRVCQSTNETNKMTQAETAQYYDEINERRKSELNTSG